MTGFGDVLTVTRRARDITQAELAERVGVSQAAINRYEAGLREPDDEVIDRLAVELRVTPRFLRHGDRFVGALAVDAHMRRQKTTRASAWRRLEARLNLLRLHASLLFSEVSIAADYTVPCFDPIDFTPENAARLVRAQWQLPIGPVTNLSRRVEAAGCLIFEEDFGTSRIDGLSQWSGDHPVMLINAGLPTDRKRLTIAHELAHLCLHSSVPTEDMEAEANRFAAEFLMPAEVIKPQLRRVTIGALHELKREWGVSMQALFERAYQLRLVTAEERTSFYKALNARGWKAAEPLSELLAPEHPTLASHIATSLKDKGLTDPEIDFITGVVDRKDNPFQVSRRLRAL